jgi:hypothetical protein
VVAPEHEVRPRNTLLLLLVLLALGGYLYWVELPDQEREAEAKKFVTLKKDDVTGLLLEYPDHTIQLEKRDGQWHMTKPVDADADDVVVNNMLTAIAEADVSRSLDDVGDKLASYGLEPPEAKITVTLKDGPFPMLKVGKTTQIGSAAYLQKGDDPKVYIGTMAFQSGMKKQVKDLRDKSVITYEDQDVQKVELTKDGVTLTAERVDAEKWRVKSTAAADGYPADSAEMRALLASIRGLRIDEFVSDDAGADLTPFGLAAPQLAVKVWIGKDAAQKTLLLGAFKDDDANKKSVYAKRAELPGVVLLPDYALKNVDKSLSTLRDKTVLAFARDAATKVAVTRKDGAGFTLVKRDGAWHVEEQGEGAERGPTVTRFIDDVAAFKGTEIVAEAATVDLAPYGLTTPDLTVVVTGEGDTPIGTLIGARGPEPAGDPNAKAFVTAAGTGLVYVVKPFVFDRIDKKLADFFEKPRPSPGTSPAAGAAPGGIGVAPDEADGDADPMPEDFGDLGAEHDDVDAE